jgi:hypothetical protein
MNQDSEVNSEVLTNRWQALWPKAQSSSQLREGYPDIWTRFYTLPEGKRYPSSEEELATVLDRNNDLLTQLGPGNTILVTLSQWADTPEPTSESALGLNVAPWRVLAPRSEGNLQSDQYQHLLFTVREWGKGSLDDILKAAANDDLKGVIIAPLDLKWLYHPYDGGVDVFVPNLEEREALKSEYSEWVSDRPDGL